MSAISFAINGVGWYHISMRNVEKFLKFVLLVLVVARIFAQNPDLKQEITSQVGESINQISNLSTNQIVSSVVDNLGDIPEYSGNATVELNNNQPFFLNDECMYATTISYEYYAPLDNLGRCTYAEANISTDLMPADEREDISSVKPSGWFNKPYDFIDGGYLYNRCHLIAFVLTGENDNEKNLITGTRYFNVQGMLPYEIAVASYIRNTNNHVLYRVTPVYDGDNLVADGVVMEAYSVEDDGDGLEFCVFAYNVQPGITIDYKDGNNWESGYSEGEE